jgi:hypothetical protein
MRARPSFLKFQVGMNFDPKLPAGDRRKMIRPHPAQKLKLGHSVISKSNKRDCTASSLDACQTMIGLGCMPPIGGPAI